MKKFNKVLFISMLLSLWASGIRAQENVVLTKVVDHYDWRTEQTGTLTLEAYAPGTTIITEQITPTPCDIVLVLDVSGSMVNRLVSFEAEPSTSYSYYSYLQTKIQKGTLYYRDNDGVYYEVSDIYDWSFSGGEDYGLYYTKGGTKYYLLGTGTTTNRPWNYGAYQTIWTGVLYSKKTSSTTRLDALKSAATSFINTIKDTAVKYDIDHRISIVKFADDIYYPSDTSLLEGNWVWKPTDSSYSNVTNVVKNLTDVRTNDTTLIRIVNNLIYGGVTASDYGLTKAKYVLNQVTDTTRKKVVVLFTDGEPNHYDGFNDTVANDAISIAKEMKDNGVTIFTVGIFDNVSSDIFTYMNYVSSKYPKATCMTNGGDTSSFTYYVSASSMSELCNIFEVFAKQTVTGSAILNSLDSSSVVKDLIEQHLRLPDDVQPSDIHVYTADYNTANNKFDTAKTVFNATVSIPADKTVKVSGFDFSEHWCGNGATNGQKLIIEIPIVADEGNATLLLEGDNDYPTSLGTSGIYTANDELVALYPIPEVLMTKPINTPVKLMHFNAECMGDMVAFTWSTASETNNEYFTIERSEDAIHYSEIIRVKGAGTSANENSYNFISDKNTHGIVYYRLRQTDIDGTTETFEPIALQCNTTDNADINIYPIPAKDMLTIESSNIIKHISLHSIQGKQVKVIHINDYSARINIKDIPSGVYTIKVFAEDGNIQTKRIIKL